MILRCAGFDEIVQAGAPYHAASRHAEPPLKIPHVAIADSPDDLVILDNVILTPPSGIAWRGLWIADAIQYMGPGLSWQVADWLPGEYNAENNTIDIGPENLRPAMTITEPAFFVDSTVGSYNFAHFVFDTLPYGLLFQRARRAVPTVRPLLLPLKFSHQKQLFEVVFDFPYGDIIAHGNHQPVLVEHLAIPRRQTDLEHVPWRFSFSGIRHIREAAVTRWGWDARNNRTHETGNQRPGGWWGRLGFNRTPPASDETLPEIANRPGLKIHLHRIQDVDALRRTGNLRGRNFTNLKALSDLLLAKGYVVFEPALVPLEHLVECLSRAETIVALHGAGLANFVFSPAGTRVFEITGHDSTWRCLEALAVVLGHDFVEIRQPAAADPDNPILDIDMLAAVL